MTLKVCADHPDQPRKATREAMTDPYPNIDAMRDIDIIGQILTALGAGPDDIEKQVVQWLGTRTAMPPMRP